MEEYIVLIRNEIFERTSMLMNNVYLYATRNDYISAGVEQLLINIIESLEDLRSFLLFAIEGTISTEQKNSLRYLVKRIEDRCKEYIFPTDSIVDENTTIYEIIHQEVKELLYYLDLLNILPYIE